MKANWLSTVGPKSRADDRRCGSKWSSRGVGLLVLLAAAYGLPAARAQVSASIKGIVADPSGAPVPAATVTTKNTETAAARSAITDDAGRYQIVWLAVGQYEV